MSILPGLEVIKLVQSLKLKIKRNDWLLADTCSQAANHCEIKRNDWLRTRVRKQPIIALYFETVLKFCNVEARSLDFSDR